MVNRLLPYHVFQHPKDDLEAVKEINVSKGKAKAVDRDLLNEIQGVQSFFAVACSLINY